MATLFYIQQYYVYEPIDRHTMNLYSVAVLFQMFIMISLTFPLIHFVNMKYASQLKSKITPSLFEENNYTILLPMRNEEIYAEKKINEVIDEILDFDKAQLLILNSASTDETEKIIMETLLKSKLHQDRWHYENINIPGKSLAINIALKNVESDIIIMMDTDSKSQIGWFEKIKESFQNQTIGLIFALEKNVNGKVKDVWRGSYKNYSNSLRAYESQYDSTFIAEGSLLAFRRNALMGKKLDPKINADDSQLANIVVSNGFRSLAIDGLYFYDRDSQSRNNFARSLRRSQGLSRVLIKNLIPSMAFPSFKSRRIFWSTFFFYILVPWLFLISIIIPIYVLLNIKIHIVMWSFYLSSCLLSLAFNSSRSFIIGCSISILAMIQYCFGVNYSSWNPDRKSQ